MRLGRRPAVFNSSPQRLSSSSRFPLEGGRRTLARAGVRRPSSARNVHCSPTVGSFPTAPRGRVRISSFKSEFSSARYTLPTRRGSGNTGESAMKKLTTVKAALIGAWLLGGVLLVGTGYAL